MDHEFWQNINVKWKQIKNFTLQKVTASPVGAIVGGIWFRTDLGRAILHDGTKEQKLAHVEDVRNQAGMVTMPTITENGFNITVGNNGVIRAYDNDLWSGIAKDYNPTGGTFALTQNADNLLVYTAGVGYSIETVPNSWNLSNKIVVTRFIVGMGRVHRALESNLLALGQCEQLVVKEALTNFYKRVGDVGLELSLSGLAPVIAAAQVYSGPTKEQIAQFTLATGTLYQAQVTDTTWAEYTTNGIDPNIYNPPSGVATLPPSKWAWAYIYRSIGNDIQAFIRCGEEYFSTDTAAISGFKLPSSLDIVLAKHCMLVGYVLFQKGESSIPPERIFTPWEASLSSAGVTLHNSLLEMDGGDTANGYFGHVWEVDYNRMRNAGAANGYALLGAGGTMPGTQIAITPIGGITGPNAQAAIQQLEQAKINTTTAVNAFAPRETTLSDETASKTLPSTSLATLVGLLQTTRNCLEYLVTNMLDKAASLPTQVVASAVSFASYIETGVTTTATNSRRTVQKLFAYSTNDILNNFGPLVGAYIKDSSGTEYNIGNFAFVKDGADNTGKYVMQLALNGTLSDVLTVDSTGALNVVSLKQGGVAIDSKFFNKLTGDTVTGQTVMVHTSTALLAERSDAGSDTRTVARFTHKTSAASAVGLGAELEFAVDADGVETAIGAWRAEILDVNALNSSIVFRPLYNGTPRNTMRVDPLGADVNGYVLHDTPAANSNDDNSATTAWAAKRATGTTLSLSSGATVTSAQFVNGITFLVGVGTSTTLPSSVGAIGERCFFALAGCNGGTITVNGLSKNGNVNQFGFIAEKNAVGWSVC